MRTQHHKQKKNDIKDNYYALLLSHLQSYGYTSSYILKTASTKNVCSQRNVVGKRHTKLYSKKHVLLLALVDFHLI